MDEKLFSDVETPKTLPKEIAGEPRLETADRSQVQLYPCDLEALLPADHPARMVWRFAEGVNLQPFYDAILAREQHPGRPAVDPKILMALWLYATIEGVGSARELDRLCGQHDAYRWLCGGVSINYHTLSDFRVSHHQELDGLLTDSIAVLLHRNVVKLATVAQDGMRVRTSAGAGSFRRRPSLTECLKRAKQQVDRTARQAEGEITARQAAAQQRAARERLQRVQQALEELARVEATKARQKRPSEPRASTTDAQARVMKMADGGFRPAYNVQFATDVDSRVIVGVELTNSGSDGGQLIPMLDQIEARTGKRAKQYLADGGFLSRETVTAADALGVVLYGPVQKPKNARDRAAPCRGDSPAVKAWRLRSATDEAKALYKLRAATAEWVNADARTHRTLSSIPLRGMAKARSCALWAALAHNMLRSFKLLPEFTH
jgi:transposase